MSKLRGSITVDSNPEGTNQYSGAAAAAKKATEKAASIKSTGLSKQSVLSKAHRDAATKHSIASQYAQTEEQKQFHNGMASKHADRARFYSHNH